MVYFSFVFFPANEFLISESWGVIALLLES